MMIITFPQPFPHRIPGNAHKGDAEQLAHVEGHSLFESHLFLFQEFHEEAEEEDGEDAVAEVETGADKVAALFVDVQSDKEDNQVGNGFVELGRMAWSQHAVNHCLMCMENKCPGHIGHIANDFGIHQVA